MRLRLMANGNFIAQRELMEHDQRQQFMCRFSSPRHWMSFITRPRLLFPFKRIQQERFSLIFSSFCFPRTFIHFWLFIIKKKKSEWVRFCVIVCVIVVYLFMSTAHYQNKKWNFQKEICSSVRTTKFKFVSKIWRVLNQSYTQLWRGMIRKGCELQMYQNFFGTRSTSSHLLCIFFVDSFSLAHSNGNFRFFSWFCFCAYTWRCL